MDTCSVLAGAVDSNNVHKAGMVMNKLPISVYAPETLACTSADAAATSTGD